MYEPYDNSRSERMKSDQALDFTHPDDVIESRALSLAEKRAILAEWASDAQAVPDLPNMRQLDGGATVPLDTVLDALRALDATENATGHHRQALRPPAQRRLALAGAMRRYWRRRNPDDDSPPPCPVAALPPNLDRELRLRRDAAWGLIAA